MSFLGMRFAARRLQRGRCPPRLLRNVHALGAPLLVCVACAARSFVCRCARRASIGTCLLMYWPNRWAVAYEPTTRPQMMNSARRGVTIHRLSPKVCATAWECRPPNEKW